MKCTDCIFYWQDKDENYPSCKWTSRAPGDVPPCEYEDDYEEDD